MATIKLTIDDVEVEVEEGRTVLQAAQAAGVYIPALCGHPDLPPAPGMQPDSVVHLGGQSHRSTGDGGEYGGCGLCVVEVEGTDRTRTSCDLPAVAGMVVRTGTPGVQELRREALKAILAGHPHACLTCSQREGCSPFESCPNSLPVLERCCSKLGYCEIQAVAEFVGIKDDTPRYVHRGLPTVQDEPLFARDYNLCIGCLRCVRACRDLRGIEALGFVIEDGSVLAGPLAPSLKESACKFCGACVEVCPTGALLDVNVKRSEREAGLVPCTHACPAGIDIPRYVRLLAEGRPGESLAVVREKVPFPAVLGRVCFHPCEDVCRRSRMNEPIAIDALKRCAADQAEEWEQADTGKATPTGKRVAVVGSGPAGLTAAYYLARAGHSVTVFEALAEPGGMMRVGIPGYRLPREVLDREIETIRSAGVEIRTGSRVESLGVLREDGFDAIFLALGAHKGIKMGIEGEDGPGVMDAVSFLRDAGQGLGVEPGERVTVIGGGNAAVDAARTALRLGARDVMILYRRSRDEMPANREEVEAALEEGVSLRLLSAPKRITRKGGTLVMECLRMELGEPDAGGRRRPEPIEGSEFELEADTVIAATGQEPDVPEGMDLDTVAGGRLKADRLTMAVGSNGVFAGGDVVSGPASVIEAIASGRKAASSIDMYLGGTGNIDESLAGSDVPDASLGRDETFFDRIRVPMPCSPVDGRRSDFSEVALGFDRDMAAAEAERCLRCDLRLRISPVMMPPDEWPQFNEQSVGAAPDSDGVFRLLDESKEVIYVGSGQSIRGELREVLDSGDEWVEQARYLHYEETLMYTMRESELLQQFLQEHGRLPKGNDELF
jgi:NADPH-dependent glutamate synthase beta subunit-like oxidoreductase/NAD-dependent dihydropyrimidine dehydrogenase PreA subunit